MTKAASAEDPFWRAYVTELTEPASSSPNIVAVGAPSTVNGARSNQLDAKGVEFAHQLWPQISSSNGVHHIAWAVALKGIIGLIEGQQVLGLGGQGRNGTVGAVNAISSPHHGLMPGSHIT